MNKKCTLDQASNWKKVKSDNSYANIHHNVIVDMRPLQYSWFGHEQILFNYPKTVQCDFYASPFLEILIAWWWN